MKFRIGKLHNRIIAISSSQKYTNTTCSWYFLGKMTCARNKLYPSLYKSHLARLSFPSFSPLSISFLIPTISSEKRLRRATLGSNNENWVLVCERPPYFCDPPYKVDVCYDPLGFRHLRIVSFFMIIFLLKISHLLHNSLFYSIFMCRCILRSLKKTLFIRKWNKYQTILLRSYLLEKYRNNKN